jgi:hypothetical protein
VSLKSTDIDRAWAKLGMVIKNKGDVHAYFLEGGKLIVWTRRSHGSGKLDGNIPHKIRTQMKLNEDQFSELIACPLTRDDYVKILRDKKLIDP